MKTTTNGAAWRREGDHIMLLQPGEGLYGDVRLSLDDLRDMAKELVLFKEMQKAREAFETRPR